MRNKKLIKILWGFGLAGAIIGIVFAGIMVGGADENEAQSLSKNGEYQYHNYTTATNELQSIAANYPGITKLYSIGKSWENRDIWAMKISDNVNINETDEPDVLYMGMHHAREWMSVEVVLDFINYLVTNYTIDDNVTHVVNNRELWLIPMVNPDGYEYSRTVDNMWRKNRRDNGDSTYGVDPNRNYNGSQNGDPDGEWGGAGASHATSADTYCGPEPFSEPCTQAIRDLVIEHAANGNNFVFSVSYHSYAEEIYYPWGYATSTTLKTPDWEYQQNVAENLSAFNGYTVMQSGNAYLTTGDSDDWIYGYSKYVLGDPTYPFTIELDTSFQPPTSQIPITCEKNRGANLYLAESAGNMTSADYTSHDPIYINGNSDFTEANGVTGGNGTESNPYIIENWDINASGADGIYIENTDAYFIIRDCYIHDGKNEEFGLSKDGIVFAGVMNGKIENVTVEDNEYGILLGYDYYHHIDPYPSSNNWIINCTTQNNSIGIYFCGVRNTTLKNNSIEDSVVFASWCLPDSVYQNIDITNTLKGKPVYYLLGQKNLSYDGDYITAGIFIFVSCNNVTLSNFNSLHGILLFNTINSAFYNLSVIDAYYGVEIHSFSSNNSLKNIQIQNSGVGIYIESYSNNTVIENCSISDTAVGISVDYPCNSQGTVINNCTIWNNEIGIAIFSNNTTLRNNTLHDNDQNLMIWCWEPADYYLDIDTSNTVDGKPIYYLVDEKDATIDGNTTNIGYLGLAFCDNITIKNLNLSYNFPGILIANSTNITITNCVFSNNSWGAMFDSSNNSTINNCIFYNNSNYGILLYTSSNITVSNCSIIGPDDEESYSIGISFVNGYYNSISHCAIDNHQWYGIQLSGECNIVSNCNLSNNNYGIWFGWDAHNNSIVSNNIYNNTWGIFVPYDYGYGSSGNCIYHNNFIENTYQANDSCSNYWDTSSGGNYWSDYDEPGEGAYDNNTDGIVDTPYIIPGDSNQDNYPFMKQSGWEEVKGPVHNINKDTYYDTIQEAIDDADAGNTIEVSNGTYYENLIINKTITLIGEDRNNTIIDGGGTGNVIYISADWVNVSGFGVTNGGSIKGDCGIDFDFFNSTNNTTILDCDIYSNNYWGILLHHDSNNIIANCDIYSNIYDGIAIYYSSTNNIKNCNIYSNDNCGIYLIGLSDNNITNCIVYTNACGIYLVSSSNNQITNSTVYNNDDGIFIWDSSNNNITNCAVYNNSDYGIYLYSSSDNNRIYHNNLINNTNNAHDSCTNYWDNGVEGNYWSDYTGIDEDSDGIGDTPYNISGGDNQDNYPLIEPVGTDTIKPKITITGVENNTYYNVSVTPMITIFDLNLNTTTITLNGKNFTSGTPITEDGTYTLFVQATDKAGNPAEQTITFTIDKIAPTISFLSPDNNSVIKPGTSLDFNITDVNLWNTSYCVDNGDIQPFSSGYNISTDGWADGIYNITVYANDFAGNEITKLFVFIIDGTQPTVNIAGVINDEYYNTNVTPFIIISDAHLNISENMITLDGMPFESGTQVTSEGKHVLYVYAVDKAGNNASKTIVFIIDKTPPTITITSPEDGLITNQSVTLSYSFNDNISSVENITVSGDESPYTQERNYSIILTATDQAGNTAQDTVTFTIDKTKPIIAVSDVEDGMYYNTYVAPVVDVSDDNLNITSITLNDNPFTNGTTISAENTYTLFVQATDKAGNTANKTLIFTVDKTAPAITITEISQTTKEKTFIMHWSATASDVLYYEISTDGVNWVNVSTDTQYMFTLSKGGNTLYVRGTDNAGNKGTADITVTYQEKKQGKPGIIPGFEVTTLLVVLGICIIFLKRRFPNP